MVDEQFFSSHPKRGFYQTSAFISLFYFSILSPLFAQGISKAAVGQYIWCLNMNHGENKWWVREYFSLYMQKVVEWINVSTFITEVYWYWHHWVLNLGQKNEFPRARKKYTSLQETKNKEAYWFYQWLSMGQTDSQESQMYMGLFVVCFIPVFTFLSWILIRVVSYNYKELCSEHYFKIKSWIGNKMTQ